MSESLERLARNQTLFREVNERVETLAEGDRSEFACECSNTDCIEKVELTLAAYERIPSNSTWFVVKRDHDIPRSRGLFPKTTGTPLSRSSSPRTTWRRPIPVQMATTNHDPLVDEEALKILYRLRGQFHERRDPPSDALKAIESLIAQYEERRP